VGCGSANQTPVSVGARKEEYAAIPASSAKLPHYVRCPRQIPRTQVLPVALTLPSLIHSQNPLLLRVFILHFTSPPSLPSTGSPISYLWDTLPTATRKAFATRPPLRRSLQVRCSWVQGLPASLSASLFFVTFDCLFWRAHSRWFSSYLD
jgi:hypothetical protein